MKKLNIKRKYDDKNRLIYELVDVAERITRYDDNNNIISFFRIDKEGNKLLCVCNFSSVTQYNYKLGVPNRGNYTQVFSIYIIIVL